MSHKFSASLIFLIVSFLATAHNDKNIKCLSPVSSLYELSSLQKANLFLCVDRYLSAFKNKDYRYIIKQIYPPVFNNFVAQNPGYSVNELIEKINKKMSIDMSTMELEGFKMTNYRFNKNYSSVLKVRDALYTTFQYSTTIKYKGKSSTQLKKVIAVSNNKGAKWFFTDATDQSRAILKEKLSQSDYDFLSL